VSEERLDATSKCAWLRMTTYDGHVQLKRGGGGVWFTFVLVERVERARLPTLDASRALGRDSDINILSLTCTYYNACACLYQHMRDRKNP
jgi:hypothetical protein